MSDILRVLYGIKSETVASNGMVSLTSVSPEKAGKISKEFGNFGLGVNADWLEGKGARPVKYIKRNQREFNEKIEQLYYCAPAKMDGVEIRELLKQPDQPLPLKQILSGTLRTFGAFQLCTQYYEILDEIKFWEYEEFAHEREWRIINSRTYTFGGSYSLKEQKHVLLNCLRDSNVPDHVDALMTYFLEDYVLYTTGKRNLSFRVPEQMITSLILPKYAKEFHAELDFIGFPRLRRRAVGI